MYRATQITLESFKSHLHTVLGTMLRVSVLEEGLDQMNPEVHDNLSHAVVLGQAQGRTGQSHAHRK